MQHVQTEFGGKEAAKFDVGIVRRYFQLLNCCAAGVTGKFVILTFFGARPGPITHHQVNDIEGMVNSVTSHAATPSANVYCGLHMMSSSLARGKKGGEADVVAVLGLVADMDADTGKVGEMPVEPSFVIETSPGNSQQVLLFDKPMSPVDAKPLAVALQRATGADYGTADISHVWRIPGTLNWPSETKIKRGRSPDPFLVNLREKAL